MLSGRFAAPDAPEKNICMNSRIVTRDNRSYPTLRIVALSLECLFKPLQTKLSNTDKYNLDFTPHKPSMFIMFAGLLSGRSNLG